MRERSSLRLPAGMRDFAPAAAAARRRIAEALLGEFERWGYARVITPAFEYEDVLARGLGASRRDAAIRFVEPGSGEVVALRPDITPQIARFVATHHREERGALRFSYEGSVVRVDARTRTPREVMQAGVELLGLGGALADAELVALAAAALRAVGLPRPTIEIGHLGLAREVLRATGIAPASLPAARARIAKRDRAGLDGILRGATGTDAVKRFAADLALRAGPPAMVAAAARRAPTPAIRAALEQLAAVVAEIERRRIPAELRVDLGEVRGFDYYTGVRLQGFVPGAPDAVLRGGRYDDLLSRYGSARPAVGFAVDIEAVAAALEADAPARARRPQRPAAPRRSRTGKRG